MKRALAIVVGVVLLTTIAAGLWQARRARALERELRDVRINSANSLAAKDRSIREIRAVAGESLAVAQRLAFQTEVKLRLVEDSLEELGKVSARFRLEADSLRAVNVGIEAQRDSVGTITAEGRLDATDSLGVDVQARVEIPPDLLLPAWSWRIRRAAIPLELSLSCRQNLAVARLAGPPWAPVKIDSIAQDPKLCNPIPVGRWEPFRIEVPSLPVAVALTGLGMWIQQQIGILPD